MPIKIPQYESTTQPQGLLDIGGFPHAAPPNQPGYIGEGMQNLGNAGMMFAATVAREQSQARIVDSLKGVSDDQKYWTERLQNATTQPNGPSSVAGVTVGENGAADQVTGAATYNGMTNKLLQEYDEYTSKKIQAAAYDPQLKKHLTEQYIALRNSLWHTGLTTEFKAAQADKYNSFEDVFRNLQSEVQSGAKTPDQAKKEMGTLLANSGISIDTRNALAMNYYDRLGQAAMQGEILRNPTAVQRQLQTYVGVGDTYYDQTAWQESKNNPNAVNLRSGAAGTFQFMPDTWAAARSAIPGLPAKVTDATADQQRQAAEWLTGSNTKALTQMLGRPPTNAELRFAHYFGASGANALMKLDPNTKFTDLPNNFWQQLGEKFTNDTLIKQNPNLQGKTIGSLLGQYRQQFDNGMMPNRAVSQAAAMLPPDKLPGWIDVARGESNRQMAIARTQVEAIINDHTAMFMQGVAVNQPLTAADFNRAYGDIEGSRKFSAYQFDMATGKAIQQVQTMPTDQLTTFLESSKPNPSQPNFAWQTSRYDALVKASNMVNQERVNDPLGWALKNNVAPGLGKLDLANGDAFGQELNKRGAVARMMQEKYGTGYSLYTNSEKAALGAFMQKATETEKGMLLQSMSKNITDPMVYQAAVQAIAPDSPSTAIAGMLMNKDYVVTKNWFSSDTAVSGSSVARMILRGEALLNPSKANKAENGSGKTFNMPDDKKFIEEFNSYVGDAFASSPQAYSYYLQAVKAYYAAKSSDESDYSGNVSGDRVKEAVNNVVGGVSSIGTTGKVVRPWGMNETTFLNAVTAKLHDKMIEMGKGGTDYDNVSNYRWINYKDGQYMLSLGGELQRDASGAPLIIDITQRPNMRGEPVAFQTKDQKLQIKRSPDINNLIGNLTQAERNLIAYHENNLLNGTTGTSPDGKPVTVYSTTIQIPPGEKNAGKYVTVPGYLVTPGTTTYETIDYLNGIYGPAQTTPTLGEMVTNDAQLYTHWKDQIQAGKWPMYATAADAGKRAELIHQVMDYDSGNTELPLNLPKIQMKAPTKAQTLPSGKGMPRK